MKTLMNFTGSPDDCGRYSSSEDLREFCRTFGIEGLELMPLGQGSLIRPDMVTGVHVRCLSDWMDRDRDFLLPFYREDLDYARRMGAKYVVFHITQISDEESYSLTPGRTDEEVIDASISLLNELLDGRGYSFTLLMENLWWPGLTFLRPDLTARLLEGVHYENKGFMLDTGHLMHMNTELRTQKEALAYLNEIVLEKNRGFLPWIKGIHLHQSLNGEYIKKWRSAAHALSADEEERGIQIFEHVYAIDRHLPFTDPGVGEFIERVRPEYVTLEYITHSREEHASYLAAGIRALKGSFGQPAAHRLAIKKEV